MKEDITELKRLADVMRDCNGAHTDREMKKVHKKYSKYLY